MYDLMSVKENPLLLFRGFDFDFESATFKTRFEAKTMVQLNAMFKDCLFRKIINSND